MQGASAPIPTSEKTFLYLSAARDHLGLIITFVLTLLIPVGGIAIGIAGNEILLVPIVGGALFFIIPYFILSMLKSTIAHEYEIALVTRFGVEATATVSHKSMEDTSHYADSSKHDEDRQMIEEITYFIEYKYNYNQPYKATFCISNKALYNRIEIGSEVPIKLLPSAPDKSVPRRACLANTYGFEISDCQ